MLLVGGIVEVPHARASRFSARLESPVWPAESPFTDADMRPLDRTSDRLFYLLPRFMQHVDQPARDSLQRYYASLLETQTEDAPLLDLCASWTSHLPEDLSPERRVAAIGMNSLELAANPSATEWRVQNLNDDTALPYEDNSFAFCTIALSIDYMTRPIELLSEVARVLRPGGMVAISFSDRLFFTKAVSHWRDRRRSASALLRADVGPSDGYHVWAVGGYLHYTRAFCEAACADVGAPRGAGASRGADPLYVVQAVVDKERF